MHSVTLTNGSDCYRAVDEPEKKKPGKYPIFFCFLLSCQRIRSGYRYQLHDSKCYLVLYISCVILDQE